MTAKKKQDLICAAFQTMLDHTEDMVFIKDADMKYVDASLPFVHMAGKVRVEEIVGRTDFEIFEDQSLAKRYVADDRKLLESGENLIDYMEALPEQDGQARYGSTSKYLLHDDDGTYIGIFGITKDITREYFAHQHYQQELHYLFELPEDTYAVCYLDIDSWRLISQRRRIIEEGTLQQCSSIEELCEIALDSIEDKQCEAADFYRKFTADFLAEIFASGRTSFSFEYRRRLTDHTVHWVKNDIRFLLNTDNGHLCMMLTAKCIDEEKQKTQDLIKAAQVDGMTMLLNRETTMEQIREILRTEMEDHHVLFMIDVDNFKMLNDTYGHQTGDEFLVDLTAKIKNSFRSEDVVGRIGGDEFFVLMRKVSSPESIIAKAQQLLERVHEVCEGYTGIKLSASIGISRYPDDGVSLKTLYARADEALYCAKKKGKNRFVFSSPIE